MKYSASGIVMSVLVVVVAATGLVISVVANVFPINEYRAMQIGLETAYDCDGPEEVAMVAAVAVAFVWGSFVWALILGPRTPRLVRVVGVIAVAAHLVLLQALPEWCDEYERNQAADSPCTDVLRQSPRWSNATT